MGQQSAGEPRRAPLFRFTRRAVVLAALGTGLWLAGQATATAEELSPAATAVGTPFSAVDAVAAPSVEPVAPATSAVDPAADPTAAPVAPAAAPAPAAVTPAAALPVAPVLSAAAPAGHSAVVPVTALADPIVPAAEPVLEMAAPLRDVAAPVVAAVEQAAPPVADAAVTLADAPDTLLNPVAGALGPIADALGPVAGALAPVAGALGPVADALVPLLGPSLIETQKRPGTDSHGLNELASAARPAGAARVLAPTGDQVITPGAGGAAGVPGPVRPHAQGTGGPARAAGTGVSSFDQWPADLSAAVLAMITAALAATVDARDAAGNIASDPSFSPD